MTRAVMTRAVMTRRSLMMIRRSSGESIRVRDCVGLTAHRRGSLRRRFVFTGTEP